MMNSLMGGFSTQFIFKLFEGILILHPLILLFSELKNIFPQLFGLSFFMISISKEEKIIYTKFQEYIMKKYSHPLKKTTLTSKDNINNTFSLDKSKFSSNLYDEFEGKKLCIIPSEKSIDLFSKELNNNGLLNYISHIQSSTFSNNQLTIHQSILNSYETKKGIEYDVEWETFTTYSNKNLNNTILSDEVQINLVDDVKKFIENEDYYNTKGLPYKRGYLLYGPPGSGKTSTIKSLANQYSMDIYIINMDREMEVSTLQKLFKGIHNSKGFHIICFEDIDRCSQIKYDDVEFIRFFINELDGLIETTKRITFFTANEQKILEEIPGLMRVGRVDKKVEMTYCTDEQIVRLFNHYSGSEEKLMKKEFNIQITPAETVDLILSDTNITPTDFKLKLNNYEKVIDEKTNLKSPNKTKKRLTKLQQFEENKKEILKLEKANEKLYVKLTEVDLEIIQKKINAQEKLITSSCKKLDNFKEIFNLNKLKVEGNDDENTLPEESINDLSIT